MAATIARTSAMVGQGETLGRRDVGLISAPIFSRTLARIHFQHFSVFFLQKPNKTRYYKSNQSKVIYI